MSATLIDLLPPWQMLLVMYGITYGIQNKLTCLFGKHAVLDSLLDCTYCVGTHSGWMAWALARLVLGTQGLSALQLSFSCILWATIGGAASYLLDAFASWAEREG